MQATACSGYTIPEDMGIQSKKVCLLLWVFHIAQPTSRALEMEIAAEWGLSPRPAVTHLGCPENPGNP